MVQSLTSQILTCSQETRVAMSDDKMVIDQAAGDPHAQVGLPPILI